MANNHDSAKLTSLRVGRKQAGTRAPRYNFAMGYEERGHLSDPKGGVGVCDRCDGRRWLKFHGRTWCRRCGTRR